ncbi:amino acid ABC transporter ATP-binding protein [Luteococcus sp.]|uniref:amino acid ABC transporter ATP-binding protein n=1 Tax=Luteococcus sp. TaxID=1969402 RepID=UPI003734E55B
MPEVRRTEADVPAGVTPGDDVVVSMRGVTKSFDGHEVLRGIDLDVHRGEVLVVLGRSGSGKSTLVRTINALERIDGGTITVDGSPIPAGGAELAELRSRVAMVFQSYNLFPTMTALENVVLGPVEVLGLDAQSARERGLRLLAKVGLSEHADRVPGQMSGGQQQRVAIARALAMEPRLVLFDEPTSALDPEMVTEVLEAMLQLASEGLTMVVVTHEMSFARRAADRVVMLADGTIVEQGPPEDFFDHPRTQRARDFLAGLGADR